MSVRKERNGVRMDIKSTDYLQKIVKLVGRKDAAEVLELVTYLLADNSYSDARYFFEEMQEMVENE